MEASAALLRYTGRVSMRRTEAKYLAYGPQRATEHLRHQSLRLVMACWIAAVLIGSRATLAQSYKVDTADSQSLTTYLRQHRLPLVGAQVLSDSTGNRRIVLYGFVATEFGKNDAAAKALAYVKNEGRTGTSAPQVENRIEVRPEIARMKPQNATAAASASANESLDQVLNDIERFGVTMAPESNPP